MIIEAQNKPVQWAIIRNPTWYPTILNGYFSKMNIGNSKKMQKTSSNFQYIIAIL
jgi:hypothetical protein